VGVLATPMVEEVEGGPTASPITYGGTTVWRGGGRYCWSGAGTERRATR
jgi:hypothetical protein